MSRLLFLAAAVLTIGWSLPLEPLAPHTSRAVQSEWGEPHNGLSIRAAIDSSTVPFGDPIPVEVFFRFWPFLTDGKPRPQYVGGFETLEFYLRNPKTGTSYEGSLHEGRGVSTYPTLREGRNLQPGEFYSIRASALPCDLNGVFVPPGKYELVARYSRRAADRPLFPRVIPQFCCMTWRCPEGSPWKGVAFSAPLEIRVLEPEMPRQSVVLPTALTLNWIEHEQRLGWSWEPGTRDTVEVRRRPEHFLTLQMVRWAQLDPPRSSDQAPPEDSPEAIEMARDRSWIVSGTTQLVVLGRDQGQTLLPRLGEPDDPVRVTLEMTLYEAIGVVPKPKGLPPRGSVLLRRTIEARWPGLEREGER